MKLVEFNNSLVNLLEAPTHLLRLKKNKKKIMKGTPETIGIFLDGEMNNSKYEIIPLADLDK